MHYVIQFKSFVFLRTRNVSEVLVHYDYNYLKKHRVWSCSCINMRWNNSIPWKYRVKNQMGPFHLSPSHSVFSLYRKASHAVHEHLCHRSQAGICGCLQRDHWFPRQKQAYLPVDSLFLGSGAGQAPGRYQVLRQWELTAHSRWEPSMLCSWRRAWPWPLAFPLCLLPRNPAPAPPSCFCSPGGTSDSFWPETPPLNKRAAVTLAELMLCLSSPFYSPPPPDSPLQPALPG